MKRRAYRKLAAEPLEARLVLSSAPGLALGAGWEQVIVTLRDDVDDIRGMAGQLVGSNCGDLGHVYEHALKGFSASLPAAAVAALAKHPKVASIESDLVMQITAQTTPTGVDRIDAEQSTAPRVDGKIDVDIAILDTGVGPHSDLNIVGGVSYVGGNYNDGHGHGTHVAGIAAALDNNIGVVGVAPGARIWSVRVLGSNGSGQLSNIIKGIDWVTARADIIEIANMSLGGQGKSDAYRAAIQKSVAKGVVYVVAAGNNWADIHGSDEVFNTNDDYIPAAYPEVATISAFADSDGSPGGLGPATSYGQYGLDDGWWHPSNKSNGSSSANSEFLNANPVDSPGLGIDLVLPGVDILSSARGGGYVKMSGTSMAAPHAAGLAALYIAANERAANATEVYAIRQALITGGKSWYSAEGMTHGWGPDNYAENLGWGGNIHPQPETAPTVTSILVNSLPPSDVAVVQGSVTLTALVEKNAGTDIRTVEFFVGQSPIDPGAYGDDGWSVTWVTSSVADGQYTVTATATNLSGESGSYSITVLVDNDPDPSMLLSLSGQATLSANKKNWTATVTATVTAEGGNPVLPGAVVTGYWGTDFSKTVSATTDGTGKATFKSASLSTKTTSITFTVTSVVLEGYTLDSLRSITVNSDGTWTSTSSSSSLAAWLTAEQNRKAKDKSDPEQAVDYLMGLGLD